MNYRNRRAAEKILSKVQKIKVLLAAAERDTQSARSNRRRLSRSMRQKVISPRES
jgi:hypothetical protein